MLGGLGALNKIGVAVSQALTPSLNLDFTLGSLDSRITFTRGSKAWYFNSSGVLTQANDNVARFDYNPSTLAARGLLIEEARTNSIRNNTMQGAVAGTPGTLPTNWGIDTPGLTTSVVGTGTSNGISYIDVRINGTTSAGYGNLFFDTTSGIAATNGQTWSHSLWLSVAAGSTTNVSTIRHAFDQYSSVPAYLATVSSNLTGISSSLTRFSAALATNNASTAFVRPSLSLLWSVGVAIDITLRIGLPQLELGAFATSVIPTTTTALTRNADVASMTGTNFSSWYNAVAGTIYAEASVPVAAAYSGYVYLFGIFNDGIQYYRQSDFQPVNRVRVSSSDQFLNGFGAIWNTTGVFKNAQAYGTNDFAGVVNGGSVATDTSGTVPTVSVLNLGSTGSGSAFNGHLRRISYYPLRNTNTQLQALTGI